MVEARILQQRLELLSAAARAFTAAVGVPQLLHDASAERTSRALEASCSFALVSEYRLWLVPAAFFSAVSSNHQILKELAASAALRIDSPHPLARSLQTVEHPLIP